MPISPEEVIKEREVRSSIILKDELFKFIDKHLIDLGFQENNKPIMIKMRQEEWAHFIYKNIICNDFTLGNLDYIILDKLKEAYEPHGWIVCYESFDHFEMISNPESYDGQSLSKAITKYLSFYKKRKESL